MRPVLNPQPRSVSGVHGDLDQTNNIRVGSMVFTDHAVVQLCLFHVPASFSTPCPSTGESDFPVQIQFSIHTRHGVRLVFLSLPSSHHPSSRSVTTPFGCLTVVCMQVTNATLFTDAFDHQLHLSFAWGLRWPF